MRKKSTQKGNKMKLEDKIDIVKGILEGKKVAVGFSGGADSTLIAYLASKVAADTLAVTIDNHLMPTGFVKNTKRISKAFEIKHETVDIDFYDDDEFLSNSSGRCFTCRNLMYSTIERVTRENGFDFICDGNNISDLVLDRPGILITYSRGFETPLIEAKLSSKEIHEYLNENNIPYSRSTTCLATRIPTGTPTTRERIERISCSEDCISDITDCEIVKVRDFGETGIVEVDDIGEILSDDKFKQIDDALKAQGFKKVALNLSQIDDNEDIVIDLVEGRFSYQLPFTINLENTKKQIGNIISYDGERIELDNMTIFENGLIEGHDFDDYDTALDTFMEVLKRLRRNI
jgi:uncharacterized protein